MAFLIGKKFHRHTIDAIPQVGRRRPVGKNVSEMAAAPAAVHFDLQIAVDWILFGSQRTVNRIVEARPAGVAFVFRLGDEQRVIAACANEGARAFRIISAQLPAGSVPNRRMTMYCSGFSNLRHSASLRVTGYCGFI